MVWSNIQQHYTRLPNDIGYFKGEEYDDDLRFNSDYNYNDIEDNMVIANVEIEKNDVVQVLNQKDSWEEPTFIGVLPNDTIYLHWPNLNKKLFTDEYQVMCIKKVNCDDVITHIWKRSNGNESFILEK